MNDQDLLTILEILRLVTRMVHDSGVPAQALKRLMELNPPTSKMLERIESDVKKETSEPYAQALRLIDEIERKLKTRIQ